MGRKKPKKVQNGKKKLTKSQAIEDAMKHQGELAQIKTHIDRLWDFAEKSDERLQDIEIHVNLLTRLFTTLCIEKFGMRVGVLKRMIKRIEKEAIRDSQILHLESLYNLPFHSHKKKSSSEAPPKNDPWDEIS